MSRPNIVLSMLREGACLTTGQIAAALNDRPKLVCEALSRMRAQGLIEEAGVEPRPTGARGGRRQIIWKAAPVPPAPKPKKGRKCRGVYTLEDMRLRCVVDALTGCWNWRMAFSAGVGAVYLPELGATTSFRSAALRLAGRPLQPGQRAYAKCENSECCNPRHLQALNSKEFGIALAKSDRLKGNPARRAHCLAIAPPPKLTQEMLDEIQTSEETGRALAARLDVSPSTVSRVRTRKRFTQPVSLPCSSAFTWAAAA